MTDIVTGAGGYTAPSVTIPESVGTNSPVFSGDQRTQQKSVTVSDKIHLDANPGDTTLPGGYGFGREDTTPVMPNTGKSAADKRTERLARAADRINNRLYLAGSGARGVTWGGGAVTNMTTPQIRDISKNIETEDQRQQALNRSLGANKRAYSELELIKDVNQFARDIDKLKLQGNIQAAKDLFEAKVRMAIENNNIRGMIALANAAVYAGVITHDAYRGIITSYAHDPDYMLNNKAIGISAGYKDLPTTMDPEQGRMQYKTTDREGGLYGWWQNSRLNPFRKSSAQKGGSE